VTEKTYDVVIVGGGIAGATVAKTIARSGGKRILILEAGRATGMAADKYASHVTAFQSSLINRPNTPYPNNLNAPQADVEDIRQIPPERVPNNPDAPQADVDGLGQIPRRVVDTSGYLVQKGPLPFQSDFTRALGGTSLHWLGTCLRMLPNDFKLNSLYGHGVDWPIDYKHLREYYELAEREILGVAGSVTDQHYPDINGEEINYRVLFGDTYDYPMEPIPASYLDTQLKDIVDGKTITVRGTDYPVWMSSTPAARNSIPREGYVPVGAPGDPQQGQRCQGNTSCIPICPVQAKYSALKTLHELERWHPGEGPRRRLTDGHSEVTIKTQSVATKVELDKQRRVTGITYQTYDDEKKKPDGKPQTAVGKVYVLAANAIQNATLLLASGAANTSGLVGRNLMDHPLLLTWGLTEEPVWGYRGPLSTSGLEMFRDGKFRKHSSAFRIEIGNEGWRFTDDAPARTVETMIKRGLYGSKLRDKIGEVIPRQFRLAFEMEQIPQKTNRVTIDDRYRDQLGNHRPVIHYNLPAYVRSGFEMAKQASKEMYELLGVEPLGQDEDRDALLYPREYTRYEPTDPGYLTYRDAGYTFQGAGHMAGTHRMGNTPGDSVVNKCQQTWDHDNLYLVGCGNMPTIGTSNPTLTMTALAIWAGCNIIEHLKNMR
jgi:choline dehydrogenase-like flavoprotein